MRVGRRLSDDPGRVYWVGIDEAGYGPKLGPFVMTAVLIESLGDRPPDLWGDCAPLVGRAGSNSALLWLDDSKRLYRQGKGFDRLEAALASAISEAGVGYRSDYRGLLKELGINVDPDAELSPWVGGNESLRVPTSLSVERLQELLTARPLRSEFWRILAVRALLVGPARFNQLLGQLRSKSLVHFHMFEKLLNQFCDDGQPGSVLNIASDKHGGRHYYQSLLQSVFPMAMIEGGPEGPELSRYQIEHEGRSIILEFSPKADATNGLVALAGIVSKVLREYWMTLFNRYWAQRVPGLKPSAGYPLDASRFRHELELAQVTTGHPESIWWRKV